MIPKFNFRRIFIRNDGEKDILNKHRAFLATVCFVCIGILSVLTFKSGEDSSVMDHTNEPIAFSKDGKSPGDQSAGQLSSKVNGLLQNSAREDQPEQKPIAKSTRRYVQNIEYKAPQVIERKGPDGFGVGLPLGTNLVGKLLTTIDTRETNQLYKVLLPYGGKGRNGGLIPKNSILFGAISYPGKGNKVFIQFSKALLPDGKEVKLKAQALSSKDYSPGLVGEFHGKRTERIVSTLGLTMVSAMTDTLTEREAMGKGEAVVPKATAKNAFYQGVSKVSEMEAQRQASELGNQQEYVTIPAGSEMIVNLVSTYHGGSN